MKNVHRLIMITALLVVPVTACGQGVQEPSTTTSPSVSHAASPVPALEGTADLTLVMKDSPTATPKSYHLVCADGRAESSSDLPNAGVACQFLQRHADILEPPKGELNMACTQQYGGPQEANVSGTFNGQAVSRTFTFTNGCEIGAWKAAQDLLGPAEGT